MLHFVSFPLGAYMGNKMLGGAEGGGLPCDSLASHLCAQYLVKFQVFVASLGGDILSFTVLPRK